MRFLCTEKKKPIKNNKPLVWGFPIKGRGISGFLFTGPPQSTLKAAKCEEKLSLMKLRMHKSKP